MCVQVVLNFPVTLLSLFDLSLVINCYPATRVTRDLRDVGTTGCSALESKSSASIFLPSSSKIYSPPRDSGLYHTLAARAPIIYQAFKSTNFTSGGGETPLFSHTPESPLLLPGVIAPKRLTLYRDAALRYSPRLRKIETTKHSGISTVYLRRYQTTFFAQAARLPLCVADFGLESA